MSEPARTLARRLARRFQTEPTWGWTQWRDFVDREVGEVLLRELHGFLGISLRNTLRDRPAILVNLHTKGSRRLFTLAHELGHVCLGWHGNRVGCSEADLAWTATSDEYEANAFAAELLVPEFWLQSLEADLGLPPAIERAYSLASASPTTVSLQLLRVLEPGWAFVQIDSDDVVHFTGQSEGTDANLPRRGDSWINADATGAIDIWEYQPVGWSRTAWMRYPTTSPLSSPSVESASEILRRIVEDLGYEEERARHLIQSVNGVCGAAKGRLAPDFTAEEMAGLLWQRIDGRRKLAQVASHPDFEDFVSQKARELAAG